MPVDMEEYLTTKELSARIKMAEGTIRNLVWKRVLRENIHYVKPTPRKLLFVWREIEAWLHGGFPLPGEKSAETTRSLINI